jgi:hypothetical protein
MLMRFDWRIVAVAALALALVGCGKSKPTPASAQAATEPAASPAAAGTASLDPRSATIRPLAQLLPWRTTHLTVDAAHHVYFVQESDDGNDIVFVAGPDDIAKPTMLATNSILAATGGRDNPPPSQNAFGHKTLPAAGNVQSLLALADGRVLFFFGATAGRSARSCLGMFDPQNGSISVVADAQRLADVSQMGSTLELARGELIANRPGSAADQADAPPWLLLRHSDAWALLKLGKLSATAGPSDDVLLCLDHLTAAPSPHPAAPTTAALASGDAGDEALPPAGPALPAMTNDAVHLAPAAQGFVALDLVGGALWSIDQTGVARQIASLAGLSKTLSAPAMTDDGNLVVMAADGPAFDRPDDADLDAAGHAAVASSNLRYPAIFRFSGQGKLTDTIGADAMHCYPSLSLFRVQVASLVADGGGTSWVAYDVASGQLIRVYFQP